MALLLTNKELAESLGVSRVTLWRLRSLGMPHFWVGGQLRYDLDKVLDWLEKREAV